MGHQGPWILTGEEEKERIFSCQGKEEGSKGQWAKDACSVDSQLSIVQINPKPWVVVVPKHILFGFGLLLFPRGTGLCNCMECEFLRAVQLNGEE